MSTTETRIASNGYSVHLDSSGSASVTLGDKRVGGFAAPAKFWSRSHDAQLDQRGWVAPRIYVYQTGTRLNAGEFDADHYEAAVNAVKEVTSYRWGR